MPFIHVSCEVYVTIYTLYKVSDHLHLPLQPRRTVQRIIEVIPFRILELNINFRFRRNYNFLYVQCMYLRPGRENTNRMS